MLKLGNYPFALFAQNVAAVCVEIEMLLFQANPSQPATKLHSTNTFNINTSDSQTNVFSVINPEIETAGSQSNSSLMI